MSIILTTESWVSCKKVLRAENVTNVSVLLAKGQLDMFQHIYVYACVCQW